MSHYYTTYTGPPTATINHRFNMSQVQRKSQRSRLKPRHVPPPLTHGGEILDGQDILSEFQGDLGVVLWKTFQNTMLWSESSPDERGELFATGADRRRRADLREIEGLEAPLAERLNLFADLLGNSAGADANEVAAACRWMSNWSLSKGSSGTALLYMQAAAFASNNDPEICCAVGRLARLRADYGRAETWYRLAIHVARKASNHNSFVRGSIGLGKVYWKRGALSAARRCFIRAYRAAKRHSLHELEGWALQDLAGVAIHAGRWRDAANYIRTSLQVHRAGHPLVPRLINDVANSWMGRGWFAPALRVLTPLRTYPFAPQDQLCFWGSMARAAGGATDERVFHEAATEINARLEHRVVSETGARVLLDVARGASSLGAWELAESSASRSLALAHQRGEGETRMLAESILESVQSDRAAEQNRTATPLAEPAEKLESIINALIDSANESAAAANNQPATV